MWVLPGLTFEHVLTVIPGASGQVTTRKWTFNDRSGHIGNQDLDYDYDNSSISRGRGRGRSGNTCGHRSSSSTSGCGNPDADYDNGTHGDTNDNATETSQHATWREVDQESRDIMFEEFQDQYQWHPSKNAAAYRAWEKVMSSRFSDILGMCRREAALRATKDIIKVGNDLSVLKPYMPSWIDQADWEDMIDMLWNTSRWKKKSAIA
ncbi:hypothetical protein Tco_1273803 [Tanacetum coccineum]